MASVDALYVSVGSISAMELPRNIRFQNDIIVCGVGR